MERRSFIQKGALATLGTLAFSAKSYSKIIGANDRVRVACVGFSDRHRASHVPPFKALAKGMNFEMVALSDLWNRRRDEGKAFLEKELGGTIQTYRNNEELYSAKGIDAVFISTADFQHALHTIEAVKAGCDTYTEKPLAETMEDNRAVLKAVKESGKIVQIGSQRRSGENYWAAEEFIKSGKFGDIKMVELMWNVNQPGRWRRPELTSILKESDIDWKRFLMNRPADTFDPRKYLEYRLFWPYSSGIPGQWMSHQIDTVHWFTGLKHPNSVVANGGIYQWNDGRKNADTLTVVFDYGQGNKGFQVQFTSRFSNGAGGTKEIYYSNGGELNLDTNMISPNGGLQAREAKAMGMQANLLPTMKIEGAKVESDANTGNDPLTFNHVKNWMECVRSRKTPNAPIEAGYQHSIATIMSNAAYRTGQRVTFDEKTQEVMAGDKIFKY
ncbi:Gfo/Idh/MocA family protein [Aquirufa regiilacus]|jgi:predicted dehydrogenase|uniref:Gfo/Idh/MocA family oxidoreductase n=1 Tax=Aquirufa regiilacus TaxID=3024868 RepID=A0ABU3TPR2_9BACT|nr:MULTISPECIES: Gfo/Idh/MocA family oxidoreductase [unclassified Aquirufa]MBP6054842.1 Gfo/Idh/MocA family oxidoreductase [Cytophagaceae bacterium]MBP6094307.1 Gfo/Idh/MocA family oxidoreductase [Cytophagaceae bacterium]MDT8887473.1 Gfo/Idh/MocA family oxidoreductase [Aquirufa sp. LEPPI-3A]MDU0807854.1 Gfo/Idh/MocA family oxidoreductase [Aquirufa sp. LEOWEIH-7C]